MSLEQKINKDLVVAMKAKDQVALRGIRAIKSAIMLQKTDGSGEVLTEEKEIKMLQKLVKQRKDSHDIFQQQNRDDLARIEAEEIDIISRYLPQQLGPTELESIIREIIQQSGAASMKDMGKVMGAANKRLAGRADGKTISTVVKRLLSS